MPMAATIGTIVNSSESVVSQWIEQWWFKQFAVGPYSRSPNAESMRPSRQAYARVHPPAISSL
ncbi:hypothetical protein PSAB6_460028 [Paraburkholderia sabiae]|nr:hypothetical protein PSAB6_460028 [Paraburkholderia sabiae]